MPARHGASPPYAPPVLRGTSPASSIAAPHLSEEADPVLTDETFLTRWNAHWANEPSDPTRQKNEEMERRKCGTPILPPANSQTEETELHQRILDNLRAEVEKVVKNEEFELNLRTPDFTIRVTPSSDDLDVIMQSLMDTSTSPRTSLPKTQTPQSKIKGRRKDLG